MTMRPPLGWWVSYSAAVLGCLAGAGAAWSLFAGGSARPAAATLPLPGLWLMTAAFLSRGAGRRAADVRLADVTAAAAGFVLLVSGLFLLDATARFHGVRLMDRIGLGGICRELLALSQFPLALVVLAANAVGWWRRRQDRLAEDESVG